MGRKRKKRKGTILLLAMIMMIMMMRRRIKIVKAVKMTMVLTLNQMVNKQYSYVCVKFM